MIPMATSSPAPTLQPSDVNVVYISIFVSAAAVLCWCLICGMVCCGCGLWWIWKKCHQTPNDPRSPNHRAQNYGSVDETAPLIQNEENPPEDVIEPEGAGAGRDGYGMPRSRTLSTAGVVQYPKNERRQSAVGGTEEWSTTRAAEAQLKRLCLIPSGVDQLTIYTTQSSFPLGNGDATLIVDEGTVEMETVVRYAVILHGPFVYSAGYKPASVVVYLNLEGANLLKPLKLMLKHWCKPVEVSGEAVLKLLRAPHTTGEMENFRYIFNEVQGNFLHNTATFTISEPQCLYCVEMEKESQASYNAIAFQKNLPEDDLVQFRIQLMCNSLEWNMYLTEILEEKEWENNKKGGPVSKFFFRDEQITATPHELHGPGWQAAIDGHLSVRESDFLDILGKDRDAVIAEVRSGRYPPCILYQVLYTGGVAERRRVPTFWRTELQGADVKLFFSCKVLQELVLPEEVSLTPAEPIVTTVVVKEEGEKIIRHSKYGSLQLKDLVRYAVPRVSPKWEEVGLQLDIAPHALETVEADHRDVEKRCKAMFKKWLHNGEGTGKQPRTWENVLEAVRKAVGSEVCENIEEDIVQDIECPSDPPAKKTRL